LDDQRGTRRVAASRFAAESVDLSVEMRRALGGVKFD